MTSPETPFDWQAFWADMLKGSGRALLALDGSDAAQAAMTGLDYFDAARDRRDRRAADEEPEGPLKAARERAGNVRAGSALRRYDPGIDGYPQLGSWPYVPTFTQPFGFMMPGMGPEPMSANPYDSIGLPAQVSFLSTQRPIVRGR